MKIRYSYGGDEHILAEIDESMSLDAFFIGLSMTKAINAHNIIGVLEVCPANASFLVRFNPDLIAPAKMMSKLQDIEKNIDNSDLTIATRIIEFPVYYQDPWTHETLMRFRERHQDPSGTDLDYAAKINGYSSVADFITAHHSSPWLVTMVGFVAGLPFMYQMVERDKQIEVPKYLSPRTDTPKLTVGYGGCFSCIYSVRGAGGYQMLGITPAPIYDPEQQISYLKDFMIFFKPGDIVKFKAIDKNEYEQILVDVECSKFTPLIKNVDFSLTEFKANMENYNTQLKEALYVN